MNEVFSGFHKYLLIILFLIAIAGQAQTRLSDIDTSRIAQKTIRKFLKDQVKLGIEHFEDFCPSVDETTDSSRFDFNCHHFHLRQAPATVWPRTLYPIYHRKAIGEVHRNLKMQLDRLDFGSD